MFVLNLVTPDKKLVTDLEVVEVIVPGFRGQLDILPGHAPLMTTLSTGILHYRTVVGSDPETVVVAWGYCEVGAEGVTVLAEVADSLEELDRARAEADLRKAHAESLDPILAPDQIAELQHRMDLASARLQALGVSETVSDLKGF